LTFSTFGLGQACFRPSIERFVEWNNLIVIGELHNVSETVIGEGKISKGTLAIEQVIFGNFVSSSGQNLKPNDKIQIEWISVPDQNKRRIWFLDVDSNGKIKMQWDISLEEMSEVKKHLKKKKADNLVKRIKLENEFQVVSRTKSVTEQKRVECLYSVQEAKPKKYPSFSAFLAILTSISLYYFLYRSPFRIR
jgi:hypothetical protein